MSLVAADPEARTNRRSGTGQKPSPVWVSAAAVAWALDDAPGVPPQLVSTLVAVARHADRHGKGARPSVETIAAKTRKSVRQAKRDIAALRKLKLLVLGDQSLVVDIAADRRPVVYDLPMWLRREVEDMEKAPVDAEPIDEDPWDDPWGATERGDTSDTSRGDTGDRAGCHTGSSGVTPMSPKEDTKNPAKKNVEHPPLSPERVNSVPQQREREAAFKDQKFKSPKHRLLAKYGWIIEGDADKIIGWLEEWYDVRSYGWYVEADRNGSLADCILEVLDDYYSGWTEYPAAKSTDGYHPNFVHADG